MEQASESTNKAEGTLKVRERRRTVAEEQQQEVEGRERPVMKVAFRKSDEEKRLISRLSNERES